MKLLDLFCGAGGAAMGYYWAGFRDITGVDVRPQKDYPFKFIHADVLELKDWQAEYLKGFDLIHASPPCQAFSSLTLNSHKLKKKSVDLIEPTRELLKYSKKPYVMENVVGAPLRRPLLKLCGEMFKLRVIRHRLFEIRGFPFYQPRHRKHNGTISDYYFPVYGNEGKVTTEQKQFTGRTTWRGTKEDWQRVMQTPWITNKHMIAEAVPPAYTRYIGMEFLKNMELFAVSNHSESSSVGGSK